MRDNAAMHALFNPFSFLVISLAGWMHQQQHVIDYLMEETEFFENSLVIAECGYDSR